MAVDAAITTLSPIVGTASACRALGQPRSSWYDRGTSMIAKPVALLLADLGVAKSHSRPHVPDDNPYSESQFKTLKHHPGFPDRFGSIQDARSFCQRFFAWDNFEHHHSGIALLTPADVHYGRAEQILSARAAVLDGAHAAHPERFVRKPPAPPRLPEQVWINKPLDPTEAPQQFHCSGRVRLSAR